MRLFPEESMFMKACRICGRVLNGPVYSASTESITSVRSIITTPLVVYICHNCCHVQKPALPSASEYYDKDYRISLESDNFDQLYDTVGDRCIYRTDYQAELVLNLVNLPSNARILDFGAGKASTLSKIISRRPDLVPFVFDVSDNYKKYWINLPNEQSATHKIPDSWGNKFSLVMAHFVLEHVEYPIIFFNSVAKLLNENGYFFFTIPNLFSNPGDLIAVDHVNHFSIISIKELLQKTNFSLVAIDETLFRGAWVCVAKRGNDLSRKDIKAQLVFENKINDVVKFWLEFDKKLKIATDKFKTFPSAIFGAGVYGTYIAAKIRDFTRLKCFLDNSPHLANSSHLGFPVVVPQNIPEDIEIIYSGLNPYIARSVLEPLRTNRISEIVYFDQGDI